MKAVILAGGLGTRLRPYTTLLPKPMLPLGEKPILEHLIDWIRTNGIRSIVLCISYRGKAIRDHFGDGDGFGVSIEYAESAKPLATAGQLKTAESMLQDGTFACMYGDSLYRFPLRSMIRQHVDAGAFVTINLNIHKTNLPYGVIRTAKSGRVTGWDEKPEISANINTGCYVMEPGIVGMIPKGRPYGMDDLIRGAIAKKKVIRSYVSRGGFLDIGDKESYEAAQQEYTRRLGRI